jgi:uncharacterized membrane protein
MTVAMTVMVVVMVPLILAAGVFQLFFLFALIAVWDHPESGWEAAKASMRLVKDHFWSVLGYGLLCGWNAFGVMLAGMLACGVGILFAAPFLWVWFAASTIYLYRLWTGRPLVQPRRAGGGAAAEGGPIPPTDIQPPAYS